MLKRRGFTLVELSNLLAIIAVLAAISIPVYRKLTIQDTDTAAKESLLLIRDAIRIYAAENDGCFPATDGSATTFKRQIGEQLDSRFPRCPVGTGWRRGVEMVADEVEMRGDTHPKNAWKYNYETGNFIINFSGPLVGEPETTYDQL